MKQPETTSTTPPPGFDLVRLSQFLELAGELLLAGPDGDAVAHRIAQGAALVLRIPGVAVGVLDDAGYSIRAAYGPGDASWSRVADPLARSTIAARRPVVLQAPGAGRVLVLPFRGPAVTGALELLLPAGGGLPDDDVALARVLSLLAGLGLTNARHTPARRVPSGDEFALDDVLGELATGVFAQATRAGRLRWRPAADVPRLRTDRPKLREIVTLLLEDALGHDGGDGDVEVDIAATARDSLRITVRDAAGGIAPEALPPRVHALAEALGGRVAARSTVTEGTAVTVEIPITH